MKQIRKLPVLWYYALKMRGAKRTPATIAKGTRDTVRSIYADPGEW